MIIPFVVHHLSIHSKMYPSHRNNLCCLNNQLDQNYKVLCQSENIIIIFILIILIEF